jgi:hypothetical protein
MPHSFGNIDADDGVTGTSTTGRGVVGASTAQAGIVGTSTNFVGVWGESQSPAHAGQPGVFGKSPNWQGVHGESTNQAGVFGFSANFVGVWGESQSPATAGQPGVFGKSPNWQGVHGESTNQVGVFGESQNFDGVFGTSHHNPGAGVSGHNDGGGVGVFGESVKHGSPPGAGDGDGDAVVGKSAGGRGVVGTSKTQAGVVGESDAFVGVWAESKDSTKAGLFATNNRGAGLAARLEGDVEVTGDIRLVNADCAENFDVAPTMDPIEPGTLMVIDECGAVTPSQKAYDKRVAGVVSGAGGFRPAVVLDAQDDGAHRVPIALLGKTYCKVDAQYGAIEVGDLLTTCPSMGHAMKAADPSRAFGTVIGKALRPLKAGQGLIPILIALQ